MSLDSALKKDLWVTGGPFGAAETLVAVVPFDPEPRSPTSRVGGVGAPCATGAT